MDVVDGDAGEVNGYGGLMWWMGMLVRRMDVADVDPGEVNGCGGWIRCISILVR